MPIVLRSLTVLGQPIWWIVGSGGTDVLARGEGAVDWSDIATRG